MGLVASSVGAGCSLASEGTGRTERMSPSTPTDDLDADVAGPDGWQDTGLDAREPSPDASLDAPLVPTQPDAEVDAGSSVSDALVPDADPPDAVAADAGAPDANAPDAAAADAGVGNPGPDAAPPPDAAASDAGLLDTGVADAGVECGLSGAYGLRFDFQVEWEGTSFEGVIPVIAPGKGVLTMFSSVDLRPDAKHTKGLAQVAPCGTIIPDFAAGNSIYRGEQYGVYIPEAAWESPLMPRWNMGWTAACEQPGCAFNANPLLALLGVRAVPPVSPSTEPSLELADSDGDGLPAITLLTRGPTSISTSGKAYSYPPLIAPWARARKLMLAIGVNGKVDGTVTGCGTVSGGVTQGVVEQGAVACTGVVDANGNGTGTEQSCSSDFVAFLDDNMPHWTVSSASFRALRIPNLACATVRAALP